jgi:uncharacterized peroxidase-related enzyme
VKTIAEESASGMIRRVYDAANARSGEVSELVQVMSLDAKSAQASMNFQANLMDTKNALTPYQREMLAIVISVANDCYYGAHAAAREFAKESENKKLAEALTLDYRKASLEASDRALCDFAMKLTLAPQKMNEDDLARLHEAGFNDEACVVTTQVISYVNYLNRVANALGVDPEVWMMEEPDDWMKRKGKDFLKGID